MSSSLSSVLERLVITQNPPLDSEIAAARRIVLGGRKELAELEAQIADLVSRQKQLEEHLAHHERIVFSINRFPPEILSLIFLFTLPSPEDITRRISQVYRDGGEDMPWLAGPWLVSQVCSRWRDVALTSPSLWASPFLTRGIRQSLGRLDLQLVRSGNASLHPSLFGSSRSMVRASNLLATLIRRSDRWSSLLLAFDWTGVQPQMALLKRRVGQLEALIIKGSWSEALVPLSEGQRLDAFVIAPRLRRLSVVSVCEPAVSLVLPWHQLTHYRAVSGAHEHLAVLRLCPSLISAHLTFRTALTFTDNVSPSLRLPQLRKLHIVNSHFLPIMSTPMLQDIVLERITPEDDALLPLLAFIHRDKPLLRSISLLHSPLVTPTLISILEETPSIEMLHIHVRRGESSAVNELIGRLTMRATHMKCFVPKLATLELSGRGAFDEERFLDMVQSRRQASPRADCTCQRIQIIALRMTQKAALSASTVQRLHALAREGLYLSITPFSFFSDDLGDLHQATGNIY
ncbi:hypothetical protein C8R44DRAFT_735097 [Mycena epipterygia]|nr:hypothetical protein C8R44DRAFT_735097 [Mycena epipterygia]